MEHAASSCGDAASCDDRCLRRAEVLLRFKCELVGHDGEPAWLTADQIIERGGSKVLFDCVYELRASGAVPTRGSVNQLLGGPPCQELSGANHKGVAVGLLDSDQARPHAIAAVVSSCSS
jgi:site-specific DNA-cytosine methylase